jgi:16S rRNA (uracil1498-N3)-methyltransferase
MREGDEVLVFDGSGREWRGSLASVSRSAVRVRLGSPAAPRREVARAVTLCQALLKADKMEWVLQKATELGVARFEPLLTDRVIAAKREAPERWRRILVEATEQCGGTRVPALAEPAPLESALAATGGRGALCWEEESELHLATWLAAGRPHELRLFVGPEGGFSKREAALARERGVASVSLGPRTLRAETAAVAASTLALLAP